MTDGFGTITWWGFSPALDLQNKDVNVAFENLSIAKDKESNDAANILLIGAGDCRHIVKTIAHSYRYLHKKLNFYVIENNLELYARNMLFFTLILEPKKRMGLQEKMEMFLELFGNTLVRQQSIEYVERMSNEFIKMVTDFDYLEKRLPLFDLSMLKFKERDMLEAIFKFWKNKDRTIFDVCKCWELRLRKYLGAQYDAIPNVFDWDYSMKLVEKDAEIIHHRNYTHWRTKGVAYEIREGTYDVPNKTLASGMIFKVEGETLARRGYWGDIIVSPYIQFGIESEEQSFFQRSNKQLCSTSQDVAEFNLLSMLHEIADREKYVAPNPEVTPKQKEATLTEITEEEEETEEDSENAEAKTKEEINPLDIEYEALPVSHVKVHFLPLGIIPELHKKSKFQKHFDVVYVSNSMVHHVNSTLATVFADKATVLLETAKFMLELNKEKQSAFNQKITEMAEVIPGCKAYKPVSDKEAVAKFIYSRPSS